MHCAVAPVSSPIFTPSPRKMSPVFCKPATAPPPLSLSSASSILIKQVAPPPRNGGGGGGEEEVPPKASPALKRKRPARINIPVTSLLIDEARKASDLDRSSEVVVEGEGYSVYSKRGKRGGVLEDRYAVVLGTDGDSKQVNFNFLFLEF